MFSKNILSLRRFKKKIMKRLLTFIFVLLMLSTFASSANGDFEGKGTKISPYLIRTTSDLNTLMSLVNSGNSFANTYFELRDNIDLSGMYFEPIGNQNHHFSGIINGKGYVIRGIYVNSTSYIGLFGYVENAVINDISIDNAEIRGNHYIGGIAGYSKNSVITNCLTRGTTLGDDCVGALVGYSGEGTVIQNCFSSMQHTKYQIIGAVGGLVGYNCGKLENSYYYGSINAQIFDKSHTGGVVGYNHITAAIHYCYFFKYGDWMNGAFDYCGSLNWGECYGNYSFDTNGMTTNGNYLRLLLNTWVIDHKNENAFRTWTYETFPSFDEYILPEVIVGDINGDGEVNIADINAVINQILTANYTDDGDVNGDGEVNIADINAIIDKILGN